MKCFSPDRVAQNKALSDDQGSDIERDYWRQMGGRTGQEWSVQFLGLMLTADRLTTRRSIPKQTTPFRLRMYNCVIMFDTWTVVIDFVFSLAGQCFFSLSFFVSLWKTERSCIWWCWPSLCQFRCVLVPLCPFKVNPLCPCFDVFSFRCVHLRSILFVPVSVCPSFFVST